MTAKKKTKTPAEKPESRSDGRAEPDTVQAPDPGPGPGPGEDQGSESPPASRAPEGAPERSPDQDPPVPRRKYIDWARSKGLESTALGAAVQAGIRIDGMIKEIDFMIIIGRYQNSKSFQP
jgi:hypothetical protein